MIQFFGKFHPLFVHLPIGIYLFGLFLKAYGWYKKSEIDSGIFKLVLLVSTFSSVLSVITGLILFSGGDYEKDTVAFHRNAGIAFTVFSILLYFFIDKKWSLYLWILGLILLVLTGHLGGNLTHGEEYLSFETHKTEKKPIENVQEALVYEDIIKPIFEEKCVSCHSAKKQKGKLRLDEKDFLLKGGKNGECLNLKNPGESLLLERLNLPDGEEEHMPPKAKPQLTGDEKRIIDWWIKSGSDFEKKAKELKQTESDKKMLLTFQSGHERGQTASIIPEAEVSEPSKNAIEILKKSGVIALPVSEKTNYLSLTIFENNFSEKEIAALKEIKNNILILNARGLKNKAIFQVLPLFKNIKKLNLTGADLGDSDVQKLSSLKELQSLNLSKTGVTAKGVAYLKGNPKLKNIYLFDSKFDKKQFKTLKSQFPQTVLDTGGYTISEADSLKFGL